LIRWTSDLLCVLPLAILLTYVGGPPHWLVMLVISVGVLRLWLAIVTTFVGQVEQPSLTLRISAGVFGLVFLIPLIFVGAFALLLVLSVI
jgi:hypothetical protein